MSNPDEQLTPEQRKLKYILLCEAFMASDDDLEAILKSMLRDIERAKELSNEQEQMT